MQQQAVALLANLAADAECVGQMVAVGAGDWVENALATLPQPRFPALHEQGDHVLSVLAGAAAPADVPARPARRARTDPAEQRRGRRPGGTPSERRRLGCRHVASFQRTRESRTVSTIPRGVHTRSAKKQVKSRYFRY